ncbi:MAG: PLDc_N domain-containing protein [Dehalococcoidia bacterium]|nr:PLDc_N domain-containing protein [Dehalococcoidia bacterium]
MKHHRGMRDFSPRHRAMMGFDALMQLALLAAAQVDLLRRPDDRVRGSKWGWRAATLVNFVGPIAYFVFGRREPETHEPLAEGVV